MKQIITILLLCSCIGCASRTVNVDAISDGVFYVTVRHDAYVQGDETLTEAQKQQYLRTSELLRNVVNEAKSQSTFKLF